MRVPYSMAMFIAQVKEHHPNSKPTAGEPDGLGVARRVTFDKKTSVWLEPHLSVMRDERIQNHFTSRGGMAIIDFVADYRADDPSPFSLPHPEPKKAPAKKAAEKTEPVKKERQAAVKKASKKAD